ncbi:MAG: NAD(P)-binding domain-containing protein [Nannocystaceae bacterium]|nr:NAD(P)-binding domain-containing protein [bacterium]
MTLWTDPAGPHRRHAPAVSPRRDQTMRRGLLLATLLASLGAGAFAAYSAARSPNGYVIGRPHAQAGLSCARCHDRQQPAQEQCTGCHGPQPSTRAGHRTARASGALRCVDCHEIHGSFGGVALGEGAASRFGHGQAEPIAGLDVGPGVQGVVPVVPAQACARCHDPGDASDPMSRCLDATSTMTLCFDEHRRVDGLTLATGGAQDRIVLWTLAREAIARDPVAPGPRRSDAGLLWGVLAALVFAVLTLRTLLTRERSTARDDLAPDVRPPVRVRLPQIDASTCLGCSACVDACPYDVLALERYVATLVRPNDCCGLTTCQERCPNGSLVVRDGAPIDDRPAVAETLESADVPGLYLAGDLTGMPLIRNAINQGAVAVHSALASGRTPDRPDAFDLVIVGAGPAGLSAALAAKKEGLSFVMVEQGDLAQSIRSFPRGKLVFDQPLSVPLIGDLWLEESTKEDLLRHWTRIVRSEALPLRTRHRVSGIVRDPGGFWVECTTPEGTARFRAAAVVLAIGRRGTPRRLAAPLHPSMEDHVFYSLADARSFAQRRCVVVGLGDVAMEAALALSYTPGTSVVVIARGDDFRRGKARNIDAMRAAEAAGRLEIRWQSTVEAVEAGAVVLDGGARIPAEAVFVMIGAIAPWSFLRSIGVRRAGERKMSPAADPPPGSRVQAGHAGEASGRPPGIA